MLMKFALILLACVSTAAAQSNRSVYTSIGDKQCRTIKYLVVTKITSTEICVTEKISSSPTANEDARRAADAASTKPCLKDQK